MCPDSANIIYLVRSQTSFLRGDTTHSPWPGVAWGRRGQRGFQPPGLRRPEPQSHPPVFPPPQPLLLSPLLGPSLGPHPRAATPRPAILHRKSWRRTKGWLQQGGLGAEEGSPCGSGQGQNLGEICPRPSRPAWAQFGGRRPQAAGPGKGSSPSPFGGVPTPRGQAGGCAPGTF